MKTNSTPEQLSRRTFLRQACFIGIATLFASNLVACGDEPEPAGQLTSVCDQNLNDDIIARRQTVNYVIPSTHPTNQCANCHFFRTLQDDPACGQCEIIPGPIHPEAYCNVWVVKPA